MTVRAWFTISALVLAALAAAVAFQFFRPVPVPHLIVRSGQIRLEADPVKWCWPQRSGLRCSRSEPSHVAELSVPSRGSLRIVIAYPKQPPKGSIRITYGGDMIILSRRWTNRLRYRLNPGQTYTLLARAQYSRDVYIDYQLDFRSTRSGS